METFFSFYVLLGTLLAGGAYYYFLTPKRKLPPCPTWRLPIFGHTFHVGPSLHKKLTVWKKTFGPILSLQLGSFPTVAISDPGLIKEAMADRRFAGRPDLPFFKVRSGGTRHGILFSDGAEWVEVRRFVLQNLRDFGFGKKSMESIILEEAEALIGRLKKAAQTRIPIVFKKYVSIAVLNSIWAIVASARYEHDDPRLILSLKTLEKTLNQNQSSFYFFVPWIANWFPLISGFSGFLRDMDTQNNLIKTLLTEHAKTLVPGQPRDLMDAFLEQCQKCINTNSPFYGKVGEQVTLTVLRDLFIAGSETTSTALSFLFMYLSEFLQVQNKMFSEIDKVIGRSRLPCIDDKTKMPYTEAVTLEVLRLSSVLPTSLFHSTHADSELGGYVIPKNTMVITNLYSCHYDIQYWGDPQNFRPERFLSEDGQKIVKHDAMLAFSTGRRVCPGENLARTELFLFSTSILQQFHVTFDPAAKPSTLEPQPGIVMSTAPHQLVFTEREN